jgi:phosphatidylethanolamine/phosphatidyl-N-methylethanolamine N-methyltransferase
MNDFEPTFPGVRPLSPGRPNRLDADSVRSAYARWALVYDGVFGAVSAPGRRRAVEAVNALPGRSVLEVGVGTGLALPHYRDDKRITGIDLSPEMLALAQQRVRRLGLSQVASLLALDAEATGFAAGSFDIAVCMFVASVVPDARRLVAELKRVVRPGGHLLFVNHFVAKSGARRVVEQALANAARGLGWHADFAMEDLLGTADRRRAAIQAVPPFGLFTLVRLINE